MRCRHSLRVRFLAEASEHSVDGLTPKLTAAFTYISLHRSVTVEALEEACWSNLHGTSRQRMRDAMSECRQVVGSQHLPQAQNGHYEVRPSVMTDAGLFDMRVARAAQLPVMEAAEVYRSALELVTGKVFTYPSRASKAYSWIDLENLSQWEGKIAGVAQHCVETYRDLGAPDRAVDIAQTALEALPLHVGLTECLMRSHAAAGNLHAVETSSATSAEPTINTATRGIGSRSRP